MTVRQKYQSPALLRRTSLCPEGSPICVSVADNTNVRTDGQQVDEIYDLSDTGSTFNHVWE